VGREDGWMDGWRWRERGWSDKGGVRLRATGGTRYCRMEKRFREKPWMDTV
jgi:hypothetical protein